MKEILVLGAGLSCSSLIKYLLSNSEEENWLITIADYNLELAQSKANHSNAKAIQFDASNSEQRKAVISKVDLIISMLPASMHMLVANDCLNLSKNLITPSYISDEMKAMDNEVKDKGLIFMNEIGLDPGIDHMSAMKIIDSIKEEGHELLLFESFTGGLVAPESDNNPWNYKFTWNPRNVVLAGQGGVAKFIQEGKYKYIPYNKLFRRTEFMEIEDYGWFEGYANRDSLKYTDIYKLEGIPTLYRGTLRRKGFSRAWDMFVQLGATDDSYVLEGTETMTYREFINSFLPYNANDTVELKLRHYLKIEQDDSLWDKLVWLGIFENTVIGKANLTPAQVLQVILESKWSLEDNDKDMIVMWHKFGYKEINGNRKEINSSMVYIGEDQTYTAMSDTVGLPVGICAKMILNGTIKTPGVQLPINKEVYNPILSELEKYGVKFSEKFVEPTIY